MPSISPFDRASLILINAFCAVAQPLERGAKGLPISQETPASMAAGGQRVNRRSSHPLSAMATTSP
jgi:hypothetical protein